MKQLISNVTGTIKANIVRIKKLTRKSKYSSAYLFKSIKVVSHYLSFIVNHDSCSLHDFPP